MGAVVQVRVDPQRLEWSHPVWEPPDRTLSLGLGHALVLLALLAGAFLVQERVSSRPAPVREHGIRVRADRTLSNLHLRPTGSDRAFASIELDSWDPLREVLSLKSPPGADEAFIVGAEHGETVRVVTATGVASQQYHLDAAGCVSEEQVKALASLRADQLPKPAPLRVPAPVDWRADPRRTTASRVLAVASVALPLMAIPLVQDLWIRLAVGLTAVLLVVGAVVVMAPLLRADERRILIRGALTQRRLPLWTVADVRVQFDQRVILCDNQGEQIELDLGDDGGRVAEVIAGFAAAQPPPPVDAPGSSFAEAVSTWRRPTPLALLAPLTAVVAGVLLGR